VVDEFTSAFGGWAARRATRDDDFGEIEMALDRDAYLEWLLR
jgi:hypothetical protein